MAPSDFFPRHFPLAQTGGSKDISSFVIWIAIFMLGVVIAGITIMVVRRKILSQGSAADASEGLMSSLRQMRDSGTISPQEYDQARKAMAARFAASRVPTQVAPTRLAGPKTAHPRAPAPKAVRDSALPANPADESSPDVPGLEERPQ